MAGYGGQLVALNVEPLSSQLGAAAQAYDAQTSADFNRKSEPTRLSALNTQLEAGQIANDMSRINLDQAQQRSRLATTENNNARIAQVAATIDPNDPDAAEKWDAGMSALKEDGIDAAGQFVGRYNPALANRVTGAYGAANPVQGRSALLNGGAGEAEADTVTEAQAAALDRQFQGQSPQQLQATLSSLEGIKQGLLAVQQSQNPAMEWDNQARKLGHPEWVGQYSPANLQAHLQAVGPVDAYLQRRVGLAQAGAPNPVVPQEVVQTAGGGLTAVQQGPNGPKATQLQAPEGQWQLVGADPTTNKGVYHNTATGEERVGENPLAVGSLRGGRGGGGGPSVFQQKVQMARDTGMSEREALDYAMGKRSAVIDPVKMREAADAQAARDLYQLTMAGNPPQDPQAFLKEQSDMHFNDYQQLAQAPAVQPPAGGGAAQAPAGPGGGGAAAAKPAPAVQQPNDGRSAPQRAAVNAIIAAGGNRFAAGTTQNPYVTTNRAQYDRLPRGAWYIFTDGRKMKKP